MLHGNKMITSAVSGFSVVADRCVYSLVFKINTSVVLNQDHVNFACFWGLHENETNTYSCLKDWVGWLPVTPKWQSFDLSKLGNRENESSLRQFHLFANVMTSTKCRENSSKSTILLDKLKPQNKVHHLARVDFDHSTLAKTSKKKTVMSSANYLLSLADQPLLTNCAPRDFFPGKSPWTLASTKDVNTFGPTITGNGELALTANSIGS